MHIEYPSISNNHREEFHLVHQTISGRHKGLLVTYMPLVEAFATGIKDFGQPKVDCLIALLRLLIA